MNNLQETDVILHLLSEQIDNNSTESNYKVI
nr:MAG TPA: hypothetical protein [Caudoviricetes sp.]